MAGDKDKGTGSNKELSKPAETDVNAGSDKASPSEKGFMEDILGDVLNLDTGLPATIKDMIVRPAEVIEAYFTDRDRYVNPFRYTIILMAFTTAIATFFIDYSLVFEQALETGAGVGKEQMITDLSSVIDYNWEAYFEGVIKISVLISTKLNQVMIILILAPLVAMFSRMFFKEQEPRFRRHFVMILYSMATYSLFSILLIFVIENSFFNISVLILASMQFAYLIYVQSRYLNFKGAGKYIKGLLCVLFGYVLYSLSTAVISYVGAIIYVAINH